MIKELLTDKDNSEKIRDAIAVILASELKKQSELAQEKQIDDKEDFNIKTYIEHGRPWFLYSNGNYSFPIVNVCLQETAPDTAPGSTANNVKYIGQYFIDCYGCGNSRNEGENEDMPDDYLSAMRAWKTARIVRNILMSGFYTYLGMRDIVRKREVKKMTTIIPKNLADSAISITAARIVFEVSFFEKSPEATPVVLDEISFVSRNDGEVTLIDSLYE
jgi:hypothetical protein